MQNLKIDIDKLIQDLTQTGPKNIKKKVPSRITPNIIQPEVGLSEKFRLLTRRNTKETLSVYKSAINRFLRFIKEKESPDEWDLRRFFDHLEKEHFSRSYQRTSWYALKKYFKAKELPWPLDNSDYPQLDKSAIKKPTLSKRQVTQMIQVVKLHGEKDEKILLALTSTYGLRRSEFCSLKEKHINRSSHTLYVQTKKGGESRYHLIPSVIQPYIYPWNFDNRISISGATVIFNAILAKAGIEKEQGMGIHALRRGLATELSSTNLPPMRIYDFLRWKNRSLGMLTEYDNPNFRETDRLIFTKHPFLKVWLEPMFIFPKKQGA